MRINNKLIYTLIHTFFGLYALAPIKSQAATITQTFNSPAFLTTSGSLQTDILFNKFDNTIGTLLDVTITDDVQMVNTTRFDLISTNPNVADLLFVNATVSFSLFHTTLLDGAFNQQVESIVPQAPPAVDISVTTKTSKTNQFSGSILSLFETSNTTLPFSITFFFDARGQSHGAYNAGAQTNVIQREALTVTYDYTPLQVAAAVPEPATFVLMGLGIAGMAYRRRNSV